MGWLTWVCAGLWIYWTAKTLFIEEPWMIKSHGTKVRTRIVHLPMHQKGQSSRNDVLNGELLQPFEWHRAGATLLAYKQGLLEIPLPQWDFVKSFDLFFSVTVKEFDKPSNLTVFQKDGIEFLLDCKEAVSKAPVIMYSLGKMRQTVHYEERRDLPVPVPTSPIVNPEA